jgi:hypothetical protein
MQRNEVTDQVNKLFNSYQWRFTPLGTETEITFEHFADLYDYIEKANQFWSDKTQPIAAPIVQHWRNALNSVHSAANHKEPSIVQQQISSLHQSILSSGWPNIVSESNIADKLLNFSQPANQHRWRAFLLGATGTSQHEFQPTKPEMLAGFIEGLAFREPGLFDKFLAESSETLRKNHAERLSETVKISTKYQALEQSLQDRHTKNQADLETWRTEKIKSLDTELKSVQDRFTDLEKLYTEKLKLEAPAKYWQKRATRMRWAGFGWLAASLAFFVVIGWVLWQNFIAPSTFVDAKELSSQITATSTGKDSLLAYFSSAKNIRSLVGFSVLASLYFFVLRMLIRMTISSFHLSLDAAEREQLTYVYLALIEKGQKSDQKLIQDADRTIILQSLFSRADTGLLAGDSSPTMPGATDMASILKGGRS